MHWRGDMPTELLDYIIQAEGMMMKHSAVLPKVLQWTRLSMDEATRSRDGLSYANLGIKKFELPLLFLLRKFPQLIPLFRPELNRQHKNRTKQQLQSSAGLICVSVRSEGNESIVHAGGLMMRAWLKMAAIGFAVQPVTISSMLPYIVAMQTSKEKQFQLDEQFQQWQSVFENGLQILRRSFLIPASHTPIWMIRTGQVKNELLSNEKTFRRSVEDLLKFE